MPADSGQQELQLVVFRLKREEFAASISQVREIIRYPELTRMPRAPEYVSGLLNLRGKVFPVVDLKKRFKLPPLDVDHRTRVMVVEAEDQTMGLIVDEVVEVLRAPHEAFEIPPAIIAEVTGKYLRGVIKVDSRLLLLLDLDKLFSTEEMAELSQLNAVPEMGESVPLPGSGPEGGRT